MTQLQAIARTLRRSEEQLKRPIDLLRQGFDPAFLASYRSDEIGQLDLRALFRLKRQVDYNDRVSKHRQEVLSQWEVETGQPGPHREILDRANSIAALDRLTRGVRSKKGAKSVAQKSPLAAEIGQAILTMQGQDAPSDINQWIAEKWFVNPEEADSLLQQARRWMTLLLSEDVVLLDKLANHILRRAVVRVESITEKNTVSEEDGSDQPSGASASMETSLSSEPSSQPEMADTTIPNNLAELPIAAEQAEPSHGENLTDQTLAEVSAPLNQPSEQVDPASSTSTLEVGFGSKKKNGDKKKKHDNFRTIRSEARLSPRQRRRRWLRSLLEPYAKLRRALHRLSPYQVLMLGRGQRSQLLQLHFEYDRNYMVQAARNALCQGRHPMHDWLLSVANEAISHIAPKLEQDVFAELEEVAHVELTEAAVEHLLSVLAQRPLGRHRLMVIDAIGPKMAAVAIIDESGEVLHIDDIPCNSSRPDVVAQNVSMLSESMRRYRVALVALSNGPSRRYLIHTIQQLLARSPEGTLSWTMVDRAGADAYGATRLALQELPNISRRHRCAVWLARRLQDPLHEILKIDATKLRLGSYVRELPEPMLHEGLQQAISATIAARGIDFWNAPEHVLRLVPGLNNAAVEALVKARQAGQIESRQQLIAALQGTLDEARIRQAIGFLRVFGSAECLDATAIHPEDYRLSQRLISNAGIPAPPNAPPGWSKSSILAEATLETTQADPSSSDSEEHDPPSSEGESREVQIDAESLTDVAILQNEFTESTASLDSNASESTPPPADAEKASSEAASSLSSESDAIVTESVATATSSEMVDAENTQSASDTASLTDAITQQIREVFSRLQESCSAKSQSQLSIDIEKLARSWQVGRDKLRHVARCLQDPFHDVRCDTPSIPLSTYVPSLDRLSAGVTHWGVVSGVADYGAFADLGSDCTGLIHVSRMSAYYSEDPHQIFQVGDLVQVWVNEVDVAKRRVALSAIPPGTEVIRPEREESARMDQHNLDNRGRNRQGATRGKDGNRDDRSERQPIGNSRERGNSGQGNQDRRSGSGSRTNEPGKGAGGNRQPHRDRDRHSSNRNRRDEKREVREVIAERNEKLKLAKPAVPITDAMQKGKEPLRSFSDLMQYYQGQRVPSEDASMPLSSADGEPVAAATLASPQIATVADSADAMVDLQSNYQPTNGESITNKDLDQSPSGHE